MFGSSNIPALTIPQILLFFLNDHTLQLILIPHLTLLSILPLLSSLHFQLLLKLLPSLQLPLLLLPQPLLLPQMCFFLDLVHRDGMLELRALILLIKIALVIENVFVLMLIHEVIYPLAF